MRPNISAFSLGSSLFWLGQLLFTPLFSVLALLTFPLPPIQRNRIISLWARSMLCWLRITCGIRYQVQGLEHLPSQPAIIMSNHQSAWETLAFQLIFPPQVYLMKRELLWIPFFGWGLAMTSPIAIDRKAGFEALRKLCNFGRARLRAGFWIIIFPEGTRQSAQHLGKFHIGGAYLACTTATTVVPVIHNAGRYWSKHSYVKQAGVIRVLIGEAIDTRQLDPAALNTHVRAWMQAHQQQIDE